MNRRVKKLIKHELVHAKQYETVARSENGIKKLNYAVVKSFANAIDNTHGRNDIFEIYNDIANDKTGKYDNMKFSVIGADVNFKDYITALNTIYTKKDCTYDDIPMVIDSKHYEDVIAKKGKLTPAEETKANQYFEAQINYPQTSVWQMLYPFSAYYDNLLEKEAYKENPNLCTYIRKIFGKN